jgi:YfiH family protein
VLQQPEFEYDRENAPGNKAENYKRVCEAIGVGYGSLTLVKYAHGNGVYYAGKEDAGKGISAESDLPPCDGMVTESPYVTASTLHADCVPVFMADREKRVVGVCHAGWKGVSLNIVSNMVKTFGKKCKSSPGALIVGIGPHIMDCCFEVKEDVAGVFKKAFGGDVISVRNGSIYVSLQKAILMQLGEEGIPVENITCANMCTSCRDDLFFSHRRDKGMTGAMGSFITV